MNVSSFVFYTNSKAFIDKLSDEQAGVLLKTLLAYTTDSELREMDLTTEVAFTVIKQYIDENYQKYLEKVERNRINGGKGGRPRKTEGKKTGDEKPHGYFENPEKPNGFSENPISVSDSDSESESVSESEDNISSIPDGIDSLPKRQRIPYQDIISDYNRTCISLPKVEKLTNPRRTAIKGRCTEYDISDIHRVFESAERSDFLSGRNGKWTSCGFDWLMKPSNFIKVLEGQYENKGGDSSGTSGSLYTKEELYEKFKDDYI